MTYIGVSTKSEIEYALAHGLKMQKSYSRTWEGHGVFSIRQESEKET